MKKTKIRIMNLRRYITALKSIFVFCLIFFPIGKMAIAQTTIWSEDFESYADGDTVALNNNTSNPSPDWSYGPGSVVNKVFGTNPISGNLSFYHRQGTSTWHTETIDISMYSNVSISLKLNELTCEQGDKIETFYILDSGTPVEFGDGNGDGDFDNSTNTIYNLNGNTLVLSIVTTSEALDDKHKFDDILIQGILNVYGVDVVTACDTFTWINGITYTTSNNFATDTLTSAAGGDSVVTLNLTILYSTNGVDVVTACDTFTWIDGITYTTSNNIATYILTNEAGCDSVVSLNLTINTVNPDVTQSGETLTSNEDNGTYQWLNCPDMSHVFGATNQSFTASINGDYAVIVTAGECTDTSSCFPITTFGNPENVFGDELGIFQNPTKGKFSVDLGRIYPYAEISIMDIYGRVVYSLSVRNEQTFELTLDKPAGIYTLMVVAGDRKTLVKLIKE